MRRSTIGLFAALSLLAAAPSHAAVTIGHSEPSSNCGPNDFGQVQRTPATTVPSDGVITSFTSPSAVGTTTRLLVFAPKGGDLYTLVGRSARHSFTTASPALQTFNTRVRVEAGRVIGHHGRVCGIQNQPGVVTTAYNGPEPAIGADQAFTIVLNNVRDNFSAVLEADADDDGYGDESQDTDDDNDTVPDASDACPLDATDSVDTDRDGACDKADPDADGDTRADERDNCPLAVNPGQQDFDGDGLGDACDATPRSLERCGNLRVGTSLADTLNGTNLGDRIRGLAGNDKLFGLVGEDCLHGGPGRDRLAGGGGADDLRGDKGNDVLGGGGGADNLSGGPGKDVLTGGGGRNGLLGGAGRDSLRARNGVRDIVNCGSGRDSAKVDRKDKVRGCEKVSRPKRR